MDEKTEADLEWRTLLERLAGGCLTKAAATALRGLEPAALRAEADERNRRTQSAVALSEQGAPIPVTAFEDVSDSLDRLERAGVADARELLALRSMLEVARRLRSFVGAQTEHPSLAVLDSDPTLDELLSELQRCIADDGSISDEASPTLRRARRRALEAQRELAQRLKELMGRYEAVLRDSYYTEHEGRYALPVRADAPYRIEGIVLGSSASGATLYVEPKEATELGNRRKMAEAEVEREEARVLAELSETARGHAAELRTAFAACVEADTLAAIVRWARAAEAAPIALDDEPVLELVAVRHPLLIGMTDTVPNDIRLAAGRGLILSGPNAGGKTVCLKCLGLAALMVRSGLPVPADATSRVGWFDPVLTDIGDEQSLARSLSTFSGHVARIAECFARAQPGALLLFDEVMAGTDPDQGAALAVAALESLVEGGAAVAVTTHFERLKELGASGERFENASAGFDPETMSPTFRLTLGVPGHSAALAIAARYGIVESVLARARELTPELAGRDELLSRLEAERGALERARRTAQEEAELAARLRSEIEAERRTVRAAERERLAREGHELMLAVKKSREQLRALGEQLRQAKADRGTLRAAEKAIDEAARPLAAGGELARAMQRPRSARTGAKVEELLPGVAVHIESLDRAGTVLEAPVRGQVRVAAGSMKLTVAVSDVALSSSSRAVRTHKAAPAPTTAEPVRTQDNTCDVRGMRVEEALAAVEVFIDRLLSEGESAGFVLHGHGTGALKSAVRDYLAKSRFVSRSEPVDSDALTVLWLS